VESHTKGFPMIAELLGKAARSSESPPDPVPEPAVIPFYPYSVRFAG
jgi:hypothetical protein